MRTAAVLSATLSFLVAFGACGGQSNQLTFERRETTKALQKELSAFENAGLVIGDFPLADHAVVDGDTIHVAGLGGTSLRLLGDDTEETFKHDSERRAYEAGWEKYMRDMRGGSPRPAKFATPMGDEAKKFAERFFDGVQIVRLERDHPKEIRDYYNRYLAYVIVNKGGKELNYNIEVIRAGYSPYFSKYGYSRRFHQQFVDAENEARAAHRGIWDPTKQHYPDYDERKVWWDSRAEFIKAFEAEAADKDNYIELTNYDAPARLEAFLGKEVVLLASVSEVRLAQGNAPTRVLLARRRTSDFPLIFWDRDVYLASDIGKHVGEYIKVKGFVSRYDDPKGRRYQLQMKVDLPSQIVTAVDPDAPTP